MEIVVRQISGLGNQLFQYAAGRYYAQRYQASMRMAIDPPDRAVSHGDPRPFLLSHFSISEPAKEMSFAEHLLLSDKASVKTALRVPKRTLKIQVYREPVSKRYTFLEDLPLENRVQRLYIAGYWQAHRIADTYATALRASLTFKEPAKGKNLETLNQIETSKNSVSLHIRRGDYTLAAEGNIALPMDYYHRAIASFRERFDDPTFFVFSDDLAYAKEYLPRDIGAIFVGHNDDFSSHEDLRLMSSCRHHIIANSTFSWWGAWLNPRSDKIVYAPKQWHLRADTHYPDLMPSSWILADV